MSTEGTTGQDRAGLPPAPWGIGAAISAILPFWLLDHLLCRLFLSMGMETGGYALRALIELAVIPPTVILAVRMRWGASPASLGITRPSRDACRWFARSALVLGLLWLTLGVVLIAVLRGRFDIMHRHIALRDSLLARDGVFWAGFVLLMKAPINEELLSRGLLYGPLRNRLGPRWAILVSALISSAVHLLSWRELRLPYQQFAGGLVSAWAYERTGSLVFPIAVHAIMNAVAFAWILLVVYRLEWIQAILG
ncbi:MAG: lysostaphin resistance A-like protein [Planctomycetota bacterium]